MLLLITLYNSPVTLTIDFIEAFEQIKQSLFRRRDRSSEKEKREKRENNRDVKRGARNNTQDDVKDDVNDKTNVFMKNVY